MRNVFDTSVNEKSIIEYSDFMNSILKSPTPKIELLNTSDKKIALHSFHRFIGRQKKCSLLCQRNDLTLDNLITRDKK